MVHMYVTAHAPSTMRLFHSFLVSIALYRLDFVTSFLHENAASLCRQHLSSSSIHHQPRPPLASRQADDNDERGDSDTMSRQQLFDRFTSPKLDDPFLPLVDVSLAQIVAPTLQIAWLSSVHAPTPTWLKPVSSTLLQTRGSLVAPVLIHGAGLASCWLIGALAARAYEKDAIVPADKSLGSYARILVRVCQAGAFATGLLIMATQTDLLLEFGAYVQPGDSPETDFRLLTALVELLNDIFFEATVLITWRLYLAVQNTT